LRIVFVRRTFISEAEMNFLPTDCNARGVGRIVFILRDMPESSKAVEKKLCMTGKAGVSRREGFKSLNSMASNENSSEAKPRRRGKGGVECANKIIKSGKIRLFGELQSLLNALR
jgi:hypothetical protein